MAKKFSQIYEAKKPAPSGDLEDACWDGYVAVGTKKKNGKTVPNCVPKNEAVKEESCSCDCGEDPCVECGKSHHSIKEAKDPNEYDKEGDMAKTQLKTICRNAEDLMKMMGDDDNLPEWVQGKITKAEDYISTVRDYLQSEKERMDEELTPDGERIVKGMKKSFKDFVKKYGSEKKAKEVMYATANKLAKDK